MCQCVPSAQTFHDFWYFSENHGIFCVITKITWKIWVKGGDLYFPQKKKVSLWHLPLFNYNQKKIACFPQKLDFSEKIQRKTGLKKMFKKSLYIIISYLDSRS